jgi:hypothetical protein
VLNELSYKTGREEERLTWSARAPLFLLLVFLFLCIVSVALFCSFVCPPLLALLSVSFFIFFTSVFLFFRSYLSALAV